MGINNQYIVDLIKKRPNLTAISSHAARLPPPDIRGIDLLALIMIRNPIRRIYSVYNFERQQISNTPGAQAAKKKNLREYVKWYMNKNTGATIRNFMVRRLTRNTNLPSPIGPTHLTFAVEFVEGNCLTGLVEEFDKSAVLFEDYFDKINNPLDFSYIRQNVGPRMGTSATTDFEDIKNALGDSLWSEVLDKNSLDIELYEVVKKLIEFRFSDISNGEGKLELLRSRNRALAEAYP